MRQPLWILNSSLLLLFICVCMLTWALGEKPVPPARMQPQKDVQLEEQEAPKVSVARIYENDLFGTYVPEPEPQPKKPQIQTEPPQPPQPKKAEAPQQPEPSFLAPLEVTLKGIILTNDEENTRAIIADNQSQEENLYQVGDSIKDADVVFIGENKVILIRSNGQQETLFTSESQAQEDPGYPKRTTEWGNIIEQVDAQTYRIDPDEFIQTVPHLAYVLDELDMTTAFKNGQAVGARIGNIENSALGEALGLKSGDIITHIDGIPTDTTQKRVEIYHHILKKELGASIEVEISRDTSRTTLTYRLEQMQEDTSEEPNETDVYDVARPTNPIREKHRYNTSIMANGSKQKSTVDALRGSPSDTMLQRGSRDNAIQRTP